MKYFKSSLKYVLILGIGCLMNISYAETYYGAFAINTETGIAGGNYDNSSQEGAETGALRSCVRKHQGKPNKCRVAEAFYNSCAAIAWSPSTKRWGTGYHIEDDGRAGTRARNDCGVDDCRTVLEFCTTRIIF